MKKLYFPVPAYSGIEILRGKRSVEDVLKSPQGTVVAYTDRAVGVLDRRRAFEDKEVCFVVAEVTEDLLNQILHGDFQHFGPLAQWKSAHVLELEHGAYGMINHHAHISMEIVSG